MNGPFQNQSSELTSYDYSDIAEGTGVVNYYGIVGKISGATTYSLIPFQRYSDDAVITPGTSTFNIDLSAYNMPKTLKGTAYISCCMGSGNPGGGYFSVQFQKISGGTATNISSVIYSPTIGTSSAENNFFMAIPLTQTSFKAGDNLRVVLIGATSGTTELGMDPIRVDGGSWTWDTAAFIVSVPYRLDNL